MWIYRGDFTGKPAPFGINIATTEFYCRVSTIVCTVTRKTKKAYKVICLLMEKLILLQCVIVEIYTYKHSRYLQHLLLKSDWMPNRNSSSRVNLVKSCAQVSLHSNRRLQNGPDPFPVRYKSSLSGFDATFCS